MSMKYLVGFHVKYCLSPNLYLHTDASEYYVGDANIVFCGRS